MARNVEIKARLAGPEERAAVARRAQALAGAAAEELLQHDSFYRCPEGRLKLRRLGDGSAELIHYRRDDAPEARLSDYLRVPLAAASVATLHEALLRALGSLGDVHKRRLLWRLGQTRVHLDAVRGLGDFVELEVVLRDEQTLAEGAATAEQVLADLGLAAAPRIACAYLDLLADGR